MDSLQSMYGDDSDDEKQETTGTGVDAISDEETGPLTGGHAPKTSIPSRVTDMTATPTPGSVNSEDGRSTASKKVTRLVSYQNEEDEDEDEEDKEKESSVENIEASPVDEDSNSKSQSETKDSAMLAGFCPEGMLENIQLPPSPPTPCDPKLQRKIIKYIEMAKQGRDMNAEIQNRKDFRNPSIYEKLIEMCDIDEKGTNFPPDIYDPHMWSKESYYDELEKAQRKEMEKRDKEKKERTKIEFVTGTKRSAASDSQNLAAESKRKTKWDTQPAPGTSMMRPPIASAGVVSNITLTTTASGTKSTVIPATGTIGKKSTR